VKTLRRDWWKTLLIVLIGGPINLLPKWRVGVILPCTWRIAH
jgi:hypothetical protein